MMPGVAVSETTGALVALILVVLLAGIGGRSDRRNAGRGPQWVPVVALTTYAQGEAVLRLLRRQRIACRLMPAVERLDLPGASGVVALVPHHQAAHASTILRSY